MSASEPVSFSLDNGAVVIQTIVDTSTSPPKHTIQCDLCGKIISLSSPTNPSSFLNHRRSPRTCKPQKITSAQLSALETASTTTSQQSPECHGVYVPWTPGTVWDTYPWHQRDHLSWDLIDAPDNFGLQLRSRRCTQRGTLTNGAEGPCKSCEILPYSARFQEFVASNTGDAAPHTPYDYLNHQQLVALTRRLSKRLRRIELKVCPTL
jgi:hypothetical protein